MLDRDAQRRILDVLALAYPADVTDFPRDSIGDADVQALRAQLQYLDEHGLVHYVWAEFSGGSQFRSARITARGLDFLADDGGLSAILGTVTVRIHEDSLKQLLIDRVEASAEAAGVKRKLVDQIKALPAETVKVLSMAALRTGLAAMPDPIAWLRNTLGPG